jgi:signal transduction histidine kinase
MLRQRNEEGSAKADLSLIRKSGRLVPCEIASVIFKDSNGVENSILSIVDLRERQAKQKITDADNERKGAETIAVAQMESDDRHTKENNAWMSSVARTTYDLIWDWDISAGLISFGYNFDKVFGYELDKNKIGFKEWIGLFTPEEGTIIENKLHAILAFEKNSWEDVYQFTYPGGPVVKVTSRANLIRDEGGKLTRVIGVIHDISRLRKLEETLELEIRIKEREIIEAIVDAKESERSDIGKELHDNINQLLGASMLYLDMARKDIKNGEVYLIHSSEYTLTAIEEIRKLTKGLTTATIMDFGLCGAIEHISLDIMEASSVKIHYKLDPSLEETMT